MVAIRAGAVEVLVVKPLTSAKADVCYVLKPASM